MIHTIPMKPMTTAREIIALERLVRRALNERRYYAAYSCTESICDNIDELETEVEESNARMELERIEVEEFNARMELVGSD